jgi:hypothetical protein
MEWQHDEVRLVPAKDRLEFEHAILFSDGAELRIRFSDFDFAVLKPISARGESKNGNHSHRPRLAGAHRSKSSK